MRRTGPCWLLSAGVGEATGGSASSSMYPRFLDFVFGVCFEPLAFLRACWELFVSGVFHQIQILQQKCNLWKFLEKTYFRIPRKMKNES